jgi:predicted GIY-YIG superfamily endonuclease
MGPFYCYIIAHSNGRSTYNGYTNNLHRRLRQHNGEIKGGARATARVKTTQGGEWSYIATLTSPEWTAQRAMMHEWTIKLPTRRRPRPAKFQGPRGRIESLTIVLPQIPEPVTLCIHPDYIHLLSPSDIPQNVSITTLDV